MELSYKNNKLEKSLTTDKGLAKSYGKLAKKIKQRWTANCMYFEVEQLLARILLG